MISSEEPGRKGRRAGTGQGGFTLLELLAVVMVMALVMGMGTIQYYELRRGMEMRSAVTQVRSSLIVARQDAIVKKSRARLWFPSINTFVVDHWVEGAYWAIGEATNPLPPGVELNPLGGAMGLGEANAITFFPDGKTGRVTPYEIRIKDLHRPQESVLRVNGLTGVCTVTMP